MEGFDVEGSAKNWPLDFWESVWKTWALEQRSAADGVLPLSPGLLMGAEGISGDYDDLLALDKLGAVEELILALVEGGASYIFQLGCRFSEGGSMITAFCGFSQPRWLANSQFLFCRSFMGWIACYSKEQLTLA